MDVDERELFRALAGYANDERKMEYLENVLQENVTQEIRKLSSQLLADLYKKKSWFTNAAKHYNEVAELAKTYDEKINFFMLTAEMFIKANDHFSADDFFRKALVLEKESRKSLLRSKMVAMYIAQAECFERMNRIRNSINVYSKVLTYKPGLEQANKVRDRIALLHERLGDLKEANRIRALKESAIQAAEEEKKAREKAAAESQQDHIIEPQEGFVEI